MSLLADFARAFGIGLFVAAPVGAMALLCMQRTFARGRASGYATGAGIATADALYASVAVFGLGALTDAIVGAEPWVRLIGGVALVILGARAALASPGSCAEAEDSPSHGVQFSSAVALTLSNPQTILTFAAVFAGAGLAVGGGGWQAQAATVAGVFSGSMAWWVVLVTATGALRGRIGDTVARWVNGVSGVAIAVLGFVSAWIGLGALSAYAVHAAVAFAATAAGAVAFQIALAAGAPWGEYAMGGRFPGRFPTPMRVAAVAQAAVLVTLAALVLGDAGVGVPPFAPSWASWVVVGFSALSLVMNAITPSEGERRIWVPVAAVMLATSTLVALH